MPPTPRPYMCLNTLPVFKAMYSLFLLSCLYQDLSNVANEGLLKERFFWVPSLGDPTTIAARQNGSGIFWLIPFVVKTVIRNWVGMALQCTLFYQSSLLFLRPSFLIFFSFDFFPNLCSELSCWQTNDLSRKNALLVFKFLPFMISYFPLSVPSGLSIYWLVFKYKYNLLLLYSTSVSQVSLLYSLSVHKQCAEHSVASIVTQIGAGCQNDQLLRQNELATGWFRQLRGEENKKKFSKTLPAEQVQTMLSASDSEEGSDEETQSKDKEVLEEAYALSSSKSVPDYSGPRRSKRSKRKHPV
ncbi:unnamed protein product [Ilex paraguariensis]|uniref:Uncharacterized protein n=1 Tax=Ilex paraguariensis TaxID=185542 RepID=A0ABC8QZE1_9AQUA